MRPHLLLSQPNILAAGRAFRIAQSIWHWSLPLRFISCSTMTVSAPTQPTPPLARAVTTLRGIGPERAAQLTRLEIRPVEDLLLPRPRRYEDRRHFRPIAEVQLDEPATTRGRVIACGLKWFNHRQKSIFELILD